VLSNKSKTTDADWKIKLFRQGKKHFTNIMIKFKVLAMKAKTNNMHVMFLLKKNVRTDIIKTISTNGCTKDTQGMESSDYLSRTRI